MQLMLALYGCSCQQELKHSPSTQLRPILHICDADNHTTHLPEQWLGQTVALGLLVYYKPKPAIPAHFHIVCGCFMLQRQSQMAVIETIWPAKLTGPLCKEREYRPLRGLSRTHGECSVLMSSLSAISICSLCPVASLFSSSLRQIKANIFRFYILSTILKTFPLPAHHIIYMCMCWGRGWSMTSWLLHIYQTVLYWPPTQCLLI